MHLGMLRAEAPRFARRIAAAAFRAAAAIVLCLAGGRLVASPLTAHVDAVLVIQIVVSILVFPLAARIVAWIDRKRAVE